MKPISIPLSREQFEAKRAELIAKGVDMPPTGDRGLVRSHGVSVHFEFDGEILLLEVNHKPWMVSMETVESKILDWFQTKQAD